MKQRAAVHYHAVIRLDRLEDTLKAVTAERVLLRTMACPIAPERRHRLRGARKAGPPPATANQPLQVKRRISERGGIMVATQEDPHRHDPRPQDRYRHRRLRPLQLIVDGELIGVVPAPPPKKSTATRSTPCKKRLGDVKHQPKPKRQASTEARHPRLDTET
jgi:hypothetical protein